MTEIKKINYLKFFIITFVFSGILLISGNFENSIGAGFNLDIILKILFIVALLFYIYKKDEIETLTNVNIPILYLLAAFIPTVMSILLTACPLDLTVGTDAIVLTIAGTLTTAIWEELYFRKVGCSLFEEEGKFKWYNIIFLAFTFSMAHSLNIFLNGTFATLTQVVFTFGFGIFALALFISTKSIILTIIAHFFMNSVSDFYSLFASQEASQILYCGDFYFLIYVVYVIILIVVGLGILRRNKLIH